MAQLREILMFKRNAHTKIEMNRIDHCWTVTLLRQSANRQNRKIEYKIHKYGLNSLNWLKHHSCWEQIYRLCYLINGDIRIGLYSVCVCLFHPINSFEWIYITLTHCKRAYLLILEFIHASAAIPKQLKLFSIWFSYHFNITQSTLHQLSCMSKTKMIR